MQIRPVVYIASSRPKDCKTPVTYHSSQDDATPTTPITLALLNSTASSHLTHSKLKLSGSEDHSMTVHHFLFHAWPDQGVPGWKDKEALRDLLTTVSQLQRERECEVYVNCSAGIGRTGTFIALMSLLEPPMRFPWPVATFKPSSALKPFPGWAKNDEVAMTIDTLREQRGMMVQTEGQIAFIYEFSGRKPAEEKPLNKQ
jgi:protein tyrosine phosphatase